MMFSQTLSNWSLALIKLRQISILMIVMNQKSPQVFSTGQQSKFQQLELEVAALEKQVENALKEQKQLIHDYNSSSSIPVIYVNDQIAKTGVRLTPDAVN